MWPPSSELVLFAFRIVAIAFQRTIDRTRRSSSGSTGGSGSSWGGIVFRYGVVPAGAGAGVERLEPLACLLGIYLDLRCHFGSCESGGGPGGGSPSRFFSACA